MSFLSPYSVKPLISYGLEVDNKFPALQYTVHDVTITFKCLVFCPDFCIADIVFPVLGGFYVACWRRSEFI